MSMQEQRSPEWHEMRRKFIGASDAGTIMGVNPYKTIYQLWLEKLGLTKPTPTNAACQRGIDLEPIALKEFNKVYHSAFIPKVVFHPTIPYMMASLDGIEESSESILEIKCNGYATHEKIRNGFIPPSHYAQIQHQLCVTGYETANYYSYDGKDNLKMICIRDQGYIDILLEKEAEFWYCVENFIAPTMTSKDHNIQAKDNVVIRNDDEWKDAIEDYNYYNGEAKEFQIQADEAKKKLIELAGGKNVSGAGYTLKKVVRSGSVDYSCIPEIQNLDLEKYRKPDSEYWKIEEE